MIFERVTPPQSVASRGSHRAPDVLPSSRSSSVGVTFSPPSDDLAAHIALPTHLAGSRSRAAAASLDDFPALQRQVFLDDMAIEKQYHVLDDTVRRVLLGASSERKSLRRRIHELTVELASAHEQGDAARRAQQRAEDECGRLRMQIDSLSLTVSAQAKALDLERLNTITRETGIANREADLQQKEELLASSATSMEHKERELRRREEAFEAALDPRRQEVNAAALRIDRMEKTLTTREAELRRAEEVLANKTARVEREQRLLNESVRVAQQELLQRHRLMADAQSDLECVFERRVESFAHDVERRLHDATSSISASHHSAVASLRQECSEKDVCIAQLRRDVSELQQQLHLAEEAHASERSALLGFLRDEEAEATRSLPRDCRELELMLSRWRRIRSLIRSDSDNGESVVDATAASAAQISKRSHPVYGTSPQPKWRFDPSPAVTASTATAMFTSFTASSSSQPSSLSSEAHTTLAPTASRRRIVSPLKARREENESSQ